MESWVTSVVDHHDKSTDQEKLPKIAKVVPQGETQPTPRQASGKTPSQPTEEFGEETEGRPTNGKILAGDRVPKETPALPPSPTSPTAPYMSAICRRYPCNCSGRFLRQGRSSTVRIPGTSTPSQREERTAGLNEINIVKKMVNFVFCQ